TATRRHRVSSAGRRCGTRTRSAPGSHPGPERTAAAETAVETPKTAPPNHSGQVRRSIVGVKNDHFNVRVASVTTLRGEPRLERGPTIGVFVADEDPRSSRTRARTAS